jgi:hypothetical protein
MSSWVDVMSPAVLRRKLQKKSKRRRYARCSACSGRAVCRFRDQGSFVCGAILSRPSVIKACDDCGLVVDLADRSGGGIGRRIPCP